ncbi:DUF6797 domain-containing protein [Parapedobacter indicus]|uniref:Cytochrome c n=1 Tax=Parapedobacter indicus TaxID=1477437 RepID=A0A1I3VAT7_9SPHI|nr:DUF6797 domain-containing protein [Parapedobacter indicus]PPK98969.1 cytochrome c [Parapedobacter indicus]SFJ91496.1 Cytochrome c [Parapedobacter indicus]
MASVHKRLFWWAALFFMQTGCGERHQAITTNDFETAEIGPFVEAGFPFITGPLNSDKLGPGFPERNRSARTLSINLGDSAYVGFDMDLLRWSVAWDGEFLPMVTMSQISYDDFFNKGDQIPSILGTPKIATGEYAGWTIDTPNFRDPRNPIGEADSYRYGPLPEQFGRWNGLYLKGDDIGLSYTIGTTNILEYPSSTRFGTETAFSRTFALDGLQHALYLNVAEVGNELDTEVTGSVLYIYHGEARDTVTAIGVVTNHAEGLRPSIVDNKYITVRFPPTDAPIEATVLMWNGPVAKKDAFLELFSKAKIEMPDFGRGGPAYWTETVYTQGALSPDTAAYVTDILTLPLPNPWKRNVRVADAAFFDGKRAAVVTFSGDVWIVEGIDKNLERLKWRRFASGLYEPMSIEVVDGTVYVFGKEGIVRLHDLNDDGVADFYENFCNEMEQSLHSREWAADMVLAPGGGFYVAKGGIGGSSQRGTILKISADGRHVETVATGLRGPYIGIHPTKGTLSASDQQGNYVPSTPLLLVEKGDYFGFPTTPEAHQATIKSPLTWIPHRVDRSGNSQTWITGGKMGPLDEQMIHFSFARPGLFRVLIDTTSNAHQGGVSFLRANYPAPTQKGTINPADGQLYITGFNLWGSSSQGIAAFVRLRYTGLPFYLPERFKAGAQGIVLRFGVELDSAVAKDPLSFQVKRWNYKRTKEYGSGHFKLDGTPGEESMPVFSSHLSADRKAVLLVVPKMEQVMQMEVLYNLRSADGAVLEDGFWFTVNEVDEIDLTGEGFNQPIDLSINLAADRSGRTADERPSEEKGAQLFKAVACAGCHSTGVKTDGFYGPPFKDLFLSERRFEDGTSGKADADYIRESILTPAKKIVKGYDAEMPSYLGMLSESDVESLVLYIKTL